MSPALYRSVAFCTNGKNVLYYQLEIGNFCQRFNWMVQSSSGRKEVWTNTAIHSHALLRIYVIFIFHPDDNWSFQSTCWRKFSISSWYQRIFFPTLYLCVCIHIGSGCCGFQIQRWGEASSICSHSFTQPSCKLFEPLIHKWLALHIHT